MTMFSMRYSVILIIVLFVLLVQGEAARDGSCNLGMFGGKQAPYQACRAQHALQQNWFPDPIQGLFSYQTWNGMDGFWQNGVVLETMANCMLYMNNTRYKSVVMSSYRDMYELLLAYGPQPSFDDMAWYGLAYTRIYEVTNSRKFLTLAKDIFDWIWREGWDESVCGGGVWFDQNYEGKQTIENVQLVQLAAKLARLTQDDAVRAKGEKVWRWVIKSGLINPTTFQVYDGISLDTCSWSNGTLFTYTAGTLVGGLVEMDKLHKNRTLLDLAHNISISVQTRLVLNGILAEPCDKDNSCNLDENIFKGIYMRNLKYLMDHDPSSKHIPAYKTFIGRNIGSLLKSASCEPENSSCHIVYLDGPPSYAATGPVFDSLWNGPFNQSRPIQQTSALDLLLSGIYEAVTCTGKECSFDPVPPPPHKLTCKDDPCPTGQDCCAYDGQYSCCNPDQRCDTGICV